MNKIYLIGGLIILALGALFYFMTPQQKANDIQPGATVPTTDQGTSNVRAVIATSMGDITIELDPVNAPQTVANFVKLADEGFYAGTKFHRVIPQFMIQGGDPITKDDSMKARWGTGGPGYTFADEIHAENRNVRGTISMANAGPNTNGSQFFINVANNDSLDGKHTVFGKVISGMEVADAIVAVPTEGADRPIDPVTILSVTIVR